MPNDAAPRDGFTAAISVVAHAPERRRQRSGVPAQAGHCCCCCCCCLHTVGALVGAIVAPNLGRSAGETYLALAHYYDEEDCTAKAPISADDWKAITAQGPTARGVHQPVDAGERNIALAASGRSAVKVFWSTLLVLVIVAGVISVLWGGAEGLSIGGGLIVLGLPALQLGAALVTALILIGRPNAGYHYRQLAKITLGTVVGSSFGILVMVLLFMVFAGTMHVPIEWFVLPTILGLPAAAGLYLLARR